MSLAQFPNFPRPSLPRSSPPITSPSQISSPSSTSSHRACCENGRPILTDPHTGQTVCSCQYPAGLMSYPRAALPPGLESVYNASAYAGYVALGTEGSAFYSPLGTAPYDLKESAEAWRTLAASQPGFPYDPMSVYPYGPGKNATRENTNTLKAWLYEHRKNPYPTKGEKIMLAIITKMTLTQVSTWFANARRRLKKENKMTWSPRNRSEDGSDDIDNPDEDDDNRDVITPSDQHELDITSSKPSSPLTSPEGHGLSGEHNNNSSSNNNNNHTSRRPFKERIIRVDEDDDGEDDDDDEDDDDIERREMDFVTRDAFGHRRHLDDVKDRPLPLSARDRDRSPLRSASDGDVREHGISRVRPERSEDDDECRRPSSTSGELRHRSTSPSSRKLARSPSHPSSPAPRSSTDKTPVSSQPATTAATTTRPKIWSISDFINTTSSSTSSTSSSSSSSILSSSSTLPSSSSLTLSPPSASLSLSSSLSLTRPGFISPSPNVPPHRSLPGQGFLFLPPGAAHWQAAAARFAGMGGAYPLTLTYPYNLATPNVMRAGLEAHAQSVAQLARAAAEGSVPRPDPSREAEKLAVSGLARHHPAGALFSPARELDSIRPRGVPPTRLAVDTSH